MPLKDGSLTKKEQAFLQAYAVSGDRVAAERKAGLQPSCGYAVLQRPEIQRQIVAHQSMILATEGLATAVETLLTIMNDKKSPAAARVTAAKIVLDRALPQAGGGLDKQPHEMTPEELASAIDKLERFAAGKAQDVTPALELKAEAPSIFE